MIVVVGPTAVGKTALSVRLAKEIGCEIISADSRQLYKELKIGTAPPSEQELSTVRHHFIGSHSIVEEISAGQYEKEALKTLGEIYSQKNVAVLVGGSGLYISAVLKGFDPMPAIDLKQREQLNHIFDDEGLSPLLEELKDKDPEYFEQVDQKNHVRVIRALEIIRSAGVKYSALRGKGGGEGRDFDVYKVGIELEREKLYTRINTRVDRMIEDGLIQEVKELLKYKERQALRTVGYQELFDFHEGKLSMNQAVEKIKKNSRNYAKRQLTWFRKDSEIHWYSPKDYEKILGDVVRWLDT